MEVAGRVNGELTSAARSSRALHLSTDQRCLSGVVHGRLLRVGSDHDAGTAPPEGPLSPPRV